MNYLTRFVYLLFFYTSLFLLLNGCGLINKKSDRTPTLVDSTSLVDSIVKEIKPIIAKDVIDSTSLVDAIVKEIKPVTAGGDIQQQELPIWGYVVLGIAVLSVPYFTGRVLRIMMHKVIKPIGENLDKSD